MRGEWDTDGSWICCSDYSYEIGLQTIQDDGIEHWIEHLQQKNWFNLESLISFLAAVKKAEDMNLAPNGLRIENKFPVRSSETGVSE